MDNQSIFQNKRYLFWTLQLAGWSGWGVSFYLGVMFWGEAPENYSYYLPVISIIGMVLTLVLRSLYHYMWNSHAIRRIVAILTASYAAGLVWMATRAVIFQSVFGKEQSKHPDKDWGLLSYFDGAMSAFWVMLVWSGLYFGIKYYLLLQEEKQRGLKIAALAHQSQLRMLQYQLNPHFLFNTLNAISTLILDKDNDLANSMVTRLSRFLRYTLDSDPMEKVTVTEEIEAIKLYLDIEKVRFDERLRLHFDIAPEAETALVPSLLLQPLVENAIKYAVSQSRNGGSIGINANVSGNQLLLEVADDGPGLDLRYGRLPKGGGVGVSNCRERLKTLYGDQQSFRLSTTDPHGLTITIVLPVTRATKADEHT
ncbi:MAG: two-component system LytT family sensor kinase [Halioglobus sp.]|jgi:two-component system LytT family sensor kinase